MLHTHAKWCFVLKLLSSYAGIGLKDYIVEGQGLREEIVSHLWSNYWPHIPASLSYPHLRQSRQLALASRGRILLLNSYFKCGHRSWAGGEIISLYMTTLNLFSRGNIIRSSILFCLVVKHLQGWILHIWPWGLLLHGGIWYIIRQSAVKGRGQLCSIVRVSPSSELEEKWVYNLNYPVWFSKMNIEVFQLLPWRQHVRKCT